MRLICYEHRLPKEILLEEKRQLEAGGVKKQGELWEEML
jgi:hypothetical protein